MIKIFRLNDCDWYAGNNLEDCINEAIKQTGLTREEVVDNPSELTDNDMEKCHLQEEGKIDKLTFREALDDLIEDNVTFPCFFASTEY